MTTDELIRELENLIGAPSTTTVADCGLWLCAHAPDIIRELRGVERMEEACRGLLDVMEMQEQRERDELHIPGETMLCLWRDAQDAARVVLAGQEAIERFRDAVRDSTVTAIPEVAVALAGQEAANEA